MEQSPERTGRRVARALVAWAGVCALACAVSAGPQLDHWGVLVAPDQARSSRDSAAEAILATSGASDEVRARVAHLLEQPIDAGNAGGTLVRALARSSQPPDWAYRIVADRLRASQAGEAPLLLAAMSSWRTRESMRAIFERTGPDEAPAVRAAAFAALARLSGREELGSDRAAWSRLVEQSARLGERAWRDELLQGVARRADRLQETGRLAVDRLVAQLRRAALEAQPAHRPALLASMLTDDLAPVRELGFDLVRREWSATGSVGAEVASAAIRLLSHRDAEARLNAAILLEQLAPPEMDAPVGEALLQEQDPAVATALLDASARRPSPRVMPAVLRWLRDGAEPRRASVAVADALARRGALEASDRESLLAVLREQAMESLTPAACSLLASLGNEDDRERLAPLLASESSSQRQGAAAALVPFEAYWGRLAEAARADPELFVHAARAILRHSPNANGFATLRSLPSNDALRRDEWLRTMATAMPATELLAAAGAASTSRLRENLYAQLLSEPRVASEGQLPDQARAIFAGGMAYARVLLDLGREEAAVTTLDTITPLSLPEERQGLASLQASSLLALGRVDLAEVLDASPEAWLEGLRRAKGKPFAKEVLLALRSRFADALGPEAQAEVDAIERSIEGPP